MKNIIFAFVLCLLIQGYVSAETTMKLVPQVLNGQKIITQENSEAIISHKKSSVALRPPPDGYSSEGRPMILVSVYGGIGKSFDFSTEDIQVFVDGKPHGLITYDKWVGDIKQGQASELTAIESKYAALSRDAAKGAYTPSSDPEVFSPSNKDSTVGSMSGGGVTYDVSSLARSQSQINAEKQAEKDAIEMRAAKELSVADAVMLKKTTVLPNTWHRGFVAIEKIPDPTQPHEVKIIVTVAGEKHEFLLNHLKTQE
jgi:hypothetical protein